MPLYMDFHIISDITIEGVKNDHIADKAVQDRYKVKYHQFWVNEAAGRSFASSKDQTKNLVRRCTGKPMVMWLVK